MNFDQQMYIFEGFNQTFNNSFKAETVKLQDCIQEFFKTDTFDSENQYRCPKCQEESQARIKTKIKLLPRVLIIHIKRFSNTSRKLKNPLEFEETLKLDDDFLAVNSTDKVDSSDKLHEGSHLYTLQSLVVHEGYSTSHGHYYSFIKHE